ncbi:hypothetical protein Nepgr_002504 [Nepenthes gracilis]|uniref:Uncharacterized protein n=1 Tax=Nepenthes gracilis TaxID=150966 RepID=A0AAD3RYG8_NEPGR|nr:hypothetical protein Nepgr_002504 [Nepenthes gracilis]
MEIGLPITERLKEVGSSFQLPSDPLQEETQIIESSVDIEPMEPQAEVLLRLELPTTGGSIGELPLDQPGSDVVERTLIEEGSVPSAKKESHTDPKALDVGFF